MNIFTICIILFWMCQTGCWGFARSSGRITNHVAFLLSLFLLSSSLMSLLIDFTNYPDALSDINFFVGLFSLFIAIIIIVFSGTLGYGLGYIIGKNYKEDD